MFSQVSFRIKKKSYVRYGATEGLHFLFAYFKPQHND